MGARAVDQPTFSEKKSHLLFKGKSFVIFFYFDNFILKGDQFIIAGKVETDENGKLKDELSLKVSAHIKGGRHEKMIKICQPHRSHLDDDWVNR